MRHSLAFVMQPGDQRPPSLLDPRRVDSKMAIGGLLAALGAHLLVPGAIMGVLALLAASGAGHKPPVILEENVVEARFVKLGKKLDPNKIPNRKVPIKSTAPQPGVAVSKVMEPPKPNKPDAGPPPEHAEEDLLTRLGDRSQTFAEIAKREEEEGDPNGIAEGTAKTAQEGNIWFGQIKVFFQRGWTVPNTIADPTGLITKVTIEITGDRHVAGHSVVKSSGDALFDQSVEDRINELRAQNATLPEPPPELAQQYSVNWSFSINFKGSDAR